MFNEIVCARAGDENKLIITYNQQPWVADGGA
jgi:hypothetical protein